MRIETFFPYRLAVVAEAFSRQLVAVYGREHGLSREEWRLLFLLEDAGALDSLQLSQRTSLDKVQVSRAATRLESKGLITREILGSDRRLRNYAITEKGRLEFQRAFGGVESRANEILQAMPARDRAALERGIAALDRAIDKVTAPEEGRGTSFPRPGSSETDR
ncbi:MarR family winged helix-turn-helix transcriptional regulator [Paracoccus seriniphilus]|uniref:DNA-binding transcriptional regulator, MarR family n=1 Tax=Paracoccus seriniphilus TaxID=184748 RepID=A0A239PZJ7_9RHOB|nr:MarR family transcriptional regulator [Paracoccus seriniphilus]WCR16338.1 MarR family transcriptional regulator [Paracoccus seriniphilus]SNT75779.1 DNA-binding transcriptional regulator, MarR family [Paracoccus seriniphilus]